MLALVVVSVNSCALLLEPAKTRMINKPKMIFGFVIFDSQHSSGRAETVGLNLKCL